MAKVVTYLGSLFSCAAGREEQCKQYHWRVWGVLAVSQPHWVCPCSQCVCLPSLHCSGSRLLCREQALGCVYFPGLSHSGSGSWILHKGSDSIGPAFHALPRSKQLRRPGAWQALSPQAASTSYHLPSLSPSDSWVAAGTPLSSVLCVSSGELISGCDPPGGCQLSRTP